METKRTTHRFSNLAAFGVLQSGLLVRQPRLQGGTILLGRGERFLLPMQLLFEALPLSAKWSTWAVDVGIHKGKRMQAVSA